MICDQIAPQPPRATVCVPTYNEAAHVEALVTAVLESLLAAGIDGSVLILDDNSPDGTGRIAAKIAETNPRVGVVHGPGKQGLGKAYRSGFKEALAGDAELILEMDCDFSHDPADLPRLVQAAADADLVLGSRYTSGGSVKTWGRFRQAVSRTGCWYARRVLSIDVADLTGGYKCFRREVLETLPLEDVDTAGYGFQIDLTYRALREGFTVREIPIAFRDRTVGQSKMSWRITLEAALLVPLLRLHVRRSKASA